MWGHKESRNNRPRFLAAAAWTPIHGTPGARNCDRYFACIILFNPQNNPLI